MTLTPTQSEYVKWLRSMRGAPISCLLALWIVRPHPISRADMIYMTNYKKDVVGEAMRVLVDVYCYAARIKYRGEAWCLTEMGRQMCLPLFELFLGNSDARALPKGDLIAFPSSSSSSSLINSTDSILLNTPTTTPEAKSDLIALEPSQEMSPEPLPEALTELFDGLLLGCPQTIAETAMRAALAADWSVAQIECEFTLWVLYVESPLGRGIDLPPARFAAAKIKKLEKAPDFFHRKNRADKHYGSAWERWESANDFRIRRAKQLLKEVYDITFDWRFDA